MADDDLFFETLREVGGLVVGDHIVYTSGKHGSAYLNKDALYHYPEKISELCKELVEMIPQIDVDTVVGPAMGGIIIGQWVAYHLTHKQGRPIYSVYAEKAADGGFQFKRGYKARVENHKVLVVEDILNTGGSIKRILAQIVADGGNPIAVTALCNRGGVTSDDLKPAGVENLDLYSLSNLNLEAWDPEECPMCKEGRPINTTIGKGGK